MTEHDPKLFAKLAAIMGEVRHLAKDGRNNYDKYDYVTADTIAITIGQKMAAHNLAFIPSVVDVQTETYTTAKGAENYRTVVRMQMTLACGDTGAVWSSIWTGEAIDRSDKSINKAIVSAVKYFLLKTFLLAGGDDGDADAESPSIVRQPTQRNGSAPKPTPRPQAPPPALPSGGSTPPVGGKRLTEPVSNGEQTGAQKRLHAVIHDTFQGIGDENEIRHWLIKAYTGKVTPSDVRDSIKKLTDDECDQISDAVGQYQSHYQEEWRRHTEKQAA